MRKLSKFVIFCSLLGLVLVALFVPRAMAEPDDGGGGGPDGSENTPALSLELSVRETDPVAGADDVTFDAKISNGNEETSADANNVKFEVTLDSKIVPNDGTISASSDDDSGLAAAVTDKLVEGQKVTATVPSLPKGKSVTISFTAHLTEEAAGEEISQEAQITSDEIKDAIKASLVKPINVKERPVATLGIDKNVDKENADLFSTVEYTITVTNTTAKSIAHNVVVTDTFDSLLQIQGKPTAEFQVLGKPTEAGSSPAVNLQEQVLKVTADELPSGTSLVIKASCKIDETSFSSISNKAEVVSDEVQEAVSDFANVNINGATPEGPTISIAALSQLIIDSSALVSKTRVSTDGTDIGEWTYWVNSSVMTTFSDAIDAARNIITEGDLSQDKIDQAVSTLQQAKSVFEAARKQGLKKASGTVADGYLDYDGPRETLSRNDYKKTNELVDADAASLNQKNYTSSNTADSYGTKSYVISDAQWTNKKEGQLKLSFEGAYTEDEEIVEAPVYFFNVCLAHGLTPETVYKNIETLQKMYGVVDAVVICDPADSAWGLQTANAGTIFRFDETNIGSVRNYYSSFCFVNGNRHWAHNAAATMREYLFGSKDAPIPADDKSLKHRPAAIYVSIDNVGSGSLGSYSTSEFWSWIKKYYIDKQVRYYSMSQSKSAGSGINAQTFDPANAHGGAPDYVYTEDFEGLGIKKVPEISMRSALPKFVHIDDIKGTLDGNALTREKDRLEWSTDPQSGITSFEAGSTDYTYGQILKVDVTAHVDVNDADAGLEWFDCMSQPLELLSVGNLKNQCSSTKLRQTANITIEKALSKNITTEALSPEVAQKGDTLEWTITLGNEGNGATQALTVTDSLPAGLSLDGTPTSTKGEVSTAGNSFTVDFGSAPLAPKDTVTITYKTPFANGNASDTIENTAIATSNINVVQSTDSFREIKPILSIEKTLPVGTAVLNDELEYTIKVSNSGEAEARNVVVEDAIPLSLTPVGDIVCDDNATGQITENNLHVDDAALASNTALTIKVKVRVNESSEYGTVTNSVTANGSYTDSVDSSVDFEILLPELGIEKSIIHKASESGETDNADDLVYAQTDDVVTYQVVVSNKTEKSLARDVELTDVLPNGLDLAGEVTVDGQPTSSKLDEALALGNIAYGTPVTITYPVVVSMGDDNHPDNLDNIINSVSASGKSPIETVSTSKDLQILYPRLEIVKTVDDEVAQADDILNYTVTITNPVEHTIAHGTHLIDTFPADFEATGQMYLDGEPIEPNLPEPANVVYQFEGENKVYAPSDMIDVYIESDPVNSLHMHKQCPYVGEETEPQSVSAKSAYNIVKTSTLEDGSEVVPCPVCTNLLEHDADIESVYSYTHNGVDVDVSSNIDLIIATKEDGSVVKHLDSQCENLIDDVTTTPYSVIPAIAYRYPCTNADSPFYMDKVSACPVCADLVEQNVQGDATESDPEPSIASFLGELFGIAPAAETSDFSAVPDRDVFNKYEIGDTVFGEPHTIAFSGTVNNNPECEIIAPTATTSANHIAPVSSGTSTKIVHPALAIKETVDTPVAQADDILTYKINVTNTDAEAESRETVLHHLVDENLELLDFVLESDSPAEQQPDEQKPDEQQPDEQLPDDQGSVEDAGGEVAPADEAPGVYYYNEILGKIYSPEDALSLVVETADDGSSIAHIGKDCSTIVGNLSEDELQTTVSELMAGQDAEGAPLPKPCESCLSLAQVTAQDTVAQHTYKLGELTLSPDTPVSVFSEAGAENTVIHGSDACEKIEGEVTTEAMYPAFLSDFLAKLPEGTVACPDCMQLAVDTKEVSVSELLGTPTVPDDGTPRGQILAALYGVLSGDEYVSADQDAKLSQVDALMSSLQDQGAISGYAFDEPKECVSWNLVNGGSFTCPIDAKPAVSVESLASFDLGTIAPQATKTVTVRAKVKNVDELQKIPSSVSTDARYVIHVDTGVDVDIVHPTLEIQKSVDKDLVQTDDMLNYEIVVKNPVQYSEARNTRLSDVLSGPLGRVSELVVERDTSAVTPKPEWPTQPSEPDTPENPETPPVETYYMVKGYNKVYKLSDTVSYSLEIPAGGSNTWHLDKYCPWGGRADYQDSITIEEYLERSSYNPNTNPDRPPMNGNSPCDLCGKLVEVKASDSVNKVSYKAVATNETHSPEETVTVYRDDALDKDTTQRIHLNPECSKLISVDSPQEYVWTYGAMNNRIESIYADDPDADYICPDCAQIEKIEEPTTVAELLESQLASVPAMAAEEQSDTPVQETPESTLNQGTMSDESKFPEATLDTPSTDPANLDLGTIAGGEVVYIRYKAQILDSDETEVGNTASVSADYIAETSANTKTEVIYPSLLIEQSVDKDLCQTDDVLNYTVVVSNPVERSVARNVVLTETFPSGLQYMDDAVVDGNPVNSATTMAEETAPAPEVSDENTETPLAGIPLGDIAPDKPVTINFSATVTELEKNSVTPVAYAEGFHLEQINSPVTTEIVYPELAITKDVDKKDTHLGDELSYTVVIKNDVDKSVARGSMFKDVFPKGLEPISDAKVEGLEGIATIKPTDTGYEAELGDIPAGSPVTITYLAKVTSKGNESLQNVASVYGKYIATAEAPIVADAEVAVAPPRVSIEKSAAPESVEVGEAIAYKLVVTNESDGPAQSVVVTDTLKNGGSYSGEPTVEGANIVSSDWGKDTSSELTLDEIPAKGSVTITYNVSTEGCKSGEFVNEATADTEFQDPATASATVNLFTISQTSGTQTGDSVTYLMDTGVFAIGLFLVAAGVVVTGILIVKNRRD